MRTPRGNPVSNVKEVSNREISRQKLVHVCIGSSMIQSKPPREEEDETFSMIKINSLSLTDDERYR